MVRRGGWGISASLTGCLAPDVVITQKRLGCAPFPGSEKVYFSPYPHANFALTFTADSTIT